MIYSIFFTAGLALGLVVGTVVWAFASHMGKKISEMQYKAKLAQQRIEIMTSKRTIDEKLARLREANPEMTRAQEQAAEEELAKVFGSRQAR